LVRVPPRLTVVAAVVAAADAADARELARALAMIVIEGSIRPIWIVVEIKLPAAVSVATRWSFRWVEKREFFVAIKVMINCLNASFFIRVRYSRDDRQS
jgi:hypothetical protein